MPKQRSCTTCPMRGEYCGHCGEYGDYKDNDKEIEENDE